MKNGKRDGFGEGQDRRGPTGHGPVGQDRRGPTGHGPMGPMKGKFDKGKFAGKFPGKGDKGGFFSMFAGKFGKHPQQGAKTATGTAEGDAAKASYEGQINGLGDSDFPLMADISTFGPSPVAAASLSSSASTLGTVMAVAGVLGGLYVLSHVLPIGRR